MNPRFYDFRKNQRTRSAAAALRYDPAGNDPPEVLAAGSGLVAERIIALAAENAIPLREDAALVEALARLEIGTLIPRELYTVVAEVLAYVYAVDAEAGERR